MQFAESRRGGTWFRACTLVAILVIAAPASADEPPPQCHDENVDGVLTRYCPADDQWIAESQRAPEISTQRRAAAVAIAVFPGVLARGLGTLVAREKPVSSKLRWFALLGIVGAAAGGIPTGVSGGNPYLLIPFVPILVAGTGVFLQTWFADIYGAAGAGRLHGRARARTPWSIELGGTWAHDAYRDRWLHHAAARVSQDRLELGVAGHVDTEGNETAGDLDVIIRLLGEPATGEVLGTLGDTRDGSWLGVRTTARFRDDELDRVQVATFEAELIGRLDFSRLAETLRGSFAELTTGGGVERAAFRTGSEVGGLLLGRFAWGMYLGERGEVKLFYDHRRDSLAGGIAAGRAAGFVGSVGAVLDLRIAGRWATRAELEIGSAWVSTIVLRYQGGPP